MSAATYDRDNARDFYGAGEENLLRVLALVQRAIAKREQIPLEAADLELIAKHARDALFQFEGLSMEIDLAGGAK